MASSEESDPMAVSSSKSDSAASSLADQSDSMAVSSAKSDHAASSSSAESELQAVPFVKLEADVSSSRKSKPTEASSAQSDSAAAASPQESNPKEASSSSQESNPKDFSSSSRQSYPKEASSSSQESDPKDSSSSSQESNSEVLLLKEASSAQESDPVLEASASAQESELKDSSSSSQESNLEVKEASSSRESKPVLEASSSVKADPVASSSSSSANLDASRTDRFVKGLRLEYQFMRIPFELYKNCIIAKRRAVRSVIKSLRSQLEKNAARDKILKMTASHFLTEELSDLRFLLKKLDDYDHQKELEEKKCNDRIHYLETATAEENWPLWNKTLVNRLLVDYLVRSSYPQTARALAKIYRIEDLVDIGVFRELRRVTDSLKEYETNVALESRDYYNFFLAKENTKSRFEFEVRRQQYIELVRIEDVEEAAKNFKNYLHVKPWKEVYKEELGLLCKALVLRSDERSPEIQKLFEIEQWDNLIERFNIEFCEAYGVTKEPLLLIYLQAGLSALKTPFCARNGCPEKDPLSNENFLQLARRLPVLKRERSKILCHFSGEEINSTNPGYALHSGHVYGAKSIAQLVEIKPELGALQGNMKGNIEFLPVCYFHGEAIGEADDPASNAPILGTGDP